MLFVLTNESGAAARLDNAARRSRRRQMAVGALDETGQERHGSATAGVKRQYMGCAGRVANGVNAVHLFYVREKARGFRTKATPSTGSDGGAATRHDPAGSTNAHA
jgi:DDE superfamily endonuclease